MSKPDPDFDPRDLTDTDRLIAQLSETPAPVAGLSLRGLSLWAIAFLSVAALFIVTTYGARPEMRVLFSEGRLDNNLAAYAKTLFFLMVAGLALSLVWTKARPEGRLSAPSLILLALGVGGLSALTGAQLALSGTSAMDELKDGAGFCFLTVLVGGMGGLGAGWFLWLRRAAPSDPALFGALSAFAAFALMTVAYSLHCGHDAPVYLLLIYLAPNLVAAALGAFAGRWLYRW